MRRRIDPELTRRARELRNNPTPAELAIWHRLCRYDPAFTRQLVVAPFIIDLACRKAKLGIEFDGSQHLDTVPADAQRTAYLQRKGRRIVRLWNSDVLANPDGAAEYILSEATEVPRRHPPPAPPFQGGEKEDATIRLSVLFPLVSPFVDAAALIRRMTAIGWLAAIQDTGPSRRRITSQERAFARKRNSWAKPLVT